MCPALGGAIRHPVDRAPVIGTPRVLVRGAARPTAQTVRGSRWVIGWVRWGAASGYGTREGPAGVWAWGLEVGADGARTASLVARSPPPVTRHRWGGGILGSMGQGPGRAQSNPGGKTKRTGGPGRVCYLAFEKVTLQVTKHGGSKEGTIYIFLSFLSP